MRHLLDRHRRKLSARRAWLRRLLRPLPRRANVRRYPIVKWFADLAHRLPFLWSFRRRHVLPALYVGSVLSFEPVYGVQFAIAFVLALILRANLSVLMGLQLLTNPLTLAPAYFITYRTGLSALELFGWSEKVSWKVCFSFITGGDWKQIPLDTCLYALLLGGVIVGLVFALATHLLWELAAWEIRVLRRRIATIRACMSHDASAAAAPEPKHND